MTSDPANSAAANDGFVASENPVAASSHEVSKSRRGEPIYRQVEKYLLDKIESGELPPGALLPSVKELCEHFGGINHLTVRQAIGNLAKRRLVRSVQGRGTYVTELAERGPIVRRIAVVLPWLGSVLSASIAKGVQNVMRAEGMQSIILDSQRDFQHEVDNIHHLKHLEVEGAIIFPTPQSKLTEEIVHLKIDKFPFVLVDRALRDIQTSAVTVDNYSGSYQITQFLIGRGYKRIAWIGEWNVTSAQDRMAGCRDAILDANLPCDRSLFMDISDASRVGGAENVLEAWIHRLAEMSPRPDAIVCGNDSTAFAALHHLRVVGLSVPEDIAVVGFDDLEEAERSQPPLTTLRQPMEKVGEEAARLLLRQIEKPEMEPERITLPVELVVRQSA